MIQIKKKKKSSIFSMVFGKSLKNADHIIISIPRWKVKDSHKESSRFQKADFKGNIEYYHGPDGTIAYDDFIAFNYIASILTEFTSKPIQVLVDNDKRLAETDASIIFVGSPLSNSYTRILFEGFKNIPFKYVPLIETEDHPCVEGIFHTKKNVLYDAVGGWEYCLVLRVPDTKKERYFFFISGTSQFGTHAAAKYFKDHWKEFKNAKPIAGVLLELPLEDSKHARVVSDYGFQ